MNQPTRPQLTCCMIVRNERQNLPACIASAKAIVDHWVIVDTGSDDGTPDYLRQALSNLTLIETDWNDHFAQARNHSLQAADSPWILVLDADERLLPQTASQIQQLLSQDLTNIDALTLLREDQEHGQTYAWNMMTRVFRQDPDLCFVGRIHERPVLKSGRPLRIQIRSELRILHTVQFDDAAQARKDRQYSRLLDLARQEEPSPFLDFHWVLLNTVKQTHSIAERLQVLEQALAETLQAETQPGWQRPALSWAGVPVEASILELQYLWIESGQEARLLEQMPQFNPIYLLSESWCNWAIAAQRQGQAQLAEDLFWNSLNALVSDPQQGWNSWRPLSFLLGLTSQPEQQVSLAVQALLSGPNPDFEQELKQVLSAVWPGPICDLPQRVIDQMNAVLTAPRQSKFEAEQALEILTLAGQVLPVMLVPELLRLALEAALTLRATPLIQLLGPLAQEIWPDDALLQRLMRLAPGPALTEPLRTMMARLQHSLQPASFAQSYQHVGCQLPFLPPAVSQHGQWQVTVRGEIETVPLAIQAQILRWLHRPASRLDRLNWRCGSMEIEMTSRAALTSPWAASIQTLRLG